MSTDCIAEVSNELAREFQRVLPHSTITAIVSGSWRGLAGHALEDGFPEMLARLSRTRLTNLHLELIA